MTATPAAERVEFPGGAGAQLAGVLHRPGAGTDIVGAALLCHCFTCSKDLYTTTRIAKGLAAGGYLTLAFDFTGLGDSGGELADTTVATNVSDITAAAVALIRRGAGPCVLVGHSLGGAAAVLAAARLHTVTAVVAVASPASAAHVEHLAGVRRARLQHGPQLLGPGAAPGDLEGVQLNELLHVGVEPAQAVAARQTHRIGRPPQSLCDLRRKE